MILFFLSSGLFLGWSLGANDAANVFGTAVATRMVRFRTAALICGVFVIIGAVVSGSGASGTLGRLGAVNALAGSFMVALAAALAVMWMTRAGLPVSVSQAIIGGIIGWNLFTGSRTDIASLVKIVSTWVVCPLLSAALAAGGYVIVRRLLSNTRLHLLKLDAATRAGLIAAGAFGSFALGANNIANVMGVFVPAIPSRSYSILGLLHVSHSQLLFLIGGIAIAVGVYSYSHRVMLTVGRSLFKLTPVTALVVIVAESLVLFLFASEGLENWLIARGLPTIPLVPVSSSQAVIGAVLGIALVKGGRNIKGGMLKKIAGGWVATPAIAGVVAFLGLFFLQNVFGLAVHRPMIFEIDSHVIERLEREGISDDALEGLSRREFDSQRALNTELKASTALDAEDRYVVVDLAEVDRFEIDLALLKQLDLKLLSMRQVNALAALGGRTFDRSWKLRDALVEETPQWAPRPDTRENNLANKRLETQFRYVMDTFRVAD